MTQVLVACIKRLDVYKDSIKICESKICMKKKFVLEQPVLDQESYNQKITLMLSFKATLCTTG